MHGTRASASVPSSQTFEDVFGLPGKGFLAQAKRDLKDGGSIEVRVIKTSSLGRVAVVVFEERSELKRALPVLEWGPYDDLVKLFEAVYREVGLTVDRPGSNKEHIGLLIGAGITLVS